MDFTACNKRGAAFGHINALPNELLSQVLKLVPFSTKTAAHSVSKRWNQLLRQPIIPDLWNECELDLGNRIIDFHRDKKLWQTADWLARRAFGITLLVIISKEWQSYPDGPVLTESGCFYKQQLPYLIGQLQFKGIDLKLSFATDLHLLLDPLLHDPVLQSYVNHNLAELALKQHWDHRELHHRSLDSLWNLTKLQTLDLGLLHKSLRLQISPCLSQLTNLRSFHIKRGILEGPLVLALGSLPALIEFKTSSTPDSILDVHLGQFTSLRSFTKSSAYPHSGDVPAPFALNLPRPPAGPTLSRGQSLGLLRKLSLHDCVLATAPPRLAVLGCLRKVKFKNCIFLRETWLDEALTGAVQIERMTIVECELTAVPPSLCRLTHLKNLTLADNDLNTLPDEFSQLTSLRFLGLYNNNWSSIPEVLECMSHLQEISLAYSHQLQIRRPLTFLLSFESLLAFNIELSSEGPREDNPSWDSVSMYHIGELIAALNNTFDNSCRRKPEFLWQS